MSLNQGPQQLMFPTVDRVENGRKVSYPAYNGFVQGCQCVSRQFQSPDTLPSPQGISQYDFVIKGGQMFIHQAEDAFVEIDVTNTGATGVAELLGCFHMLSTLQILSDQQENETLFPNQLLANTAACYSAQQSNTVFPMMGYPQLHDAAAPYSLAAGAQRTLIMPLTIFLWWCGGALLPQIFSEQRIRLNFAPVAQWTASTSTALANAVRVTRCVLYLNGVIYRPNALAAVTRKWQESTHIFPRVTTIQRQFNLGQLTAGLVSAKNTMTITPGSYAGAFAELFELDGADNEDILTPLRMDRINLYNNDGSLYNYLNTDQLLRFSASVDLFPSTPMWAVPGATGGYQCFAYPIPFVAHYDRSILARGGCAGWLMGGFETVDVISTASLVNAELRMYFSQNVVWSVLPISGIVGFTPFTNQG